MFPKSFSLFQSLNLIMKILWLNVGSQSQTMFNFAGQVLFVFVSNSISGCVFYGLSLGLGVTKGSTVHRYVYLA